MPMLLSPLYQIYSSLEAWRRHLGIEGGRMETGREKAAVRPLGPSGLTALDDVLRDVPRGVLVEVWSESSRNGLWLASEWAKTVEGQGTTLWVDPFAEIDFDMLVRTGVSAARSMRLTLEDPVMLTRALLRIIEGHLTELVIIPAGVVEQAALQGTAHPDADEKARHESFAQALSAIAFSARHARITVLLLREVRDIEHTKPLSCHVRLRLSGGESGEPRRLAVEHHAYDVSWIGRRLAL